MAADTMTQTSRLLALPLELRERIYEEVLRPYQLPMQSQDQSFPCFILHKMHMEILRVNRQVSKEAYEVMLIKHPFIRIVTRGISYPSDVFGFNQLPVLSVDEGLIGRCKALTMTHSIAFQIRNTPPRSYTVVVYKDLDAVCRSLAEAEANRDWFGARSAHVVTIHDPFATTSSPDYMNPTNQERLLMPYRQHLRGFPSFQLMGHVHPHLAVAIAGGVKQPVVIDHMSLIRDIRSQNSFARSRSVAGDNKTALSLLRGICDQLICLATRTAWPVLKARHGDDFSESVAEVFYMICYARLVTAVNLMERIAANNGSMDKIRRLALDVFEAVQPAMFVGQTLDVPWHLSQQREGDLALLLAMTHRHTRESLSRAKECIRDASRLLPGNAVVAREKEKIARWEAEVQAAST
ncbi:hypothetical protein F5Y13DRAFT_184548 [Hypoxylon sp. FL1857]|nr:hypothetical protein F5Y13DRAFT_184548 [Hypoxylon sp. FL1857]